MKKQTRPCAACHRGLAVNLGKRRYCGPRCQTVARQAAAKGRLRTRCKGSSPSKPSLM